MLGSGLLGSFWVWSGLVWLTLLHLLAVPCLLMAHYWPKWRQNEHARLSKTRQGKVGLALT